MYGYCQFPIYSLEYNKIHIQSFLVQFDGDSNSVKSS